MSRAERDSGFDQASAERWFGAVRAVLWPYFRPEVIGAENLPRGRGLVIGCHSGVLPYDAAAVLVAIHDGTGRFSRAIGDNFFGRFRPVADQLRKQGAVVGRPDVVESMLRAGHLVLVYPGGARDMERPYLTQRYRVLAHRGFAAGRGGYIKVALRTRTPIVPVALVGAEEAHVMLGNVPALARALSVPFFPLLLFPLPLPTKFYIRFGEPILLDGNPADACNQRRVDELNRMVRRRLQHLIDDTRRRREGVIFSTYRSTRPQRPHSTKGQCRTRRKGADEFTSAATPTGAGTRRGRAHGGRSRKGPDEFTSAATPIGARTRRGRAHGGKS